MPTTVEIKSAWFSKINWTQVVSVLASVLTVFGLDLPPETQVHVIAAIQGVQAVATWIFKTWFTDTVTPSSVGK